MALINQYQVEKERKNAKLKRMQINSERRTVNVKILPKHHKLLKLEAGREGVTIQTIVEKLIVNHLKNS